MVRLVAYLIGSLLAVLIVGSISERLVDYEDREAVLIFALVLGFANAYVRPAVRIVTLPLTCLTFGLFALVVNAAFFGAAAWLVPGIDANFWGAVLGGAIASIVSGIIYSVIDED